MYLQQIRHGVFTAVSLPNMGRHNCAATALVDRLAHPCIQVPCNPLRQTRQHESCRHNYYDLCGPELRASSFATVELDLTALTTFCLISAYQIPRLGRQCSVRSRHARTCLLIVLPKGSVQTRRERLGLAYEHEGPDSMESRS